MSLAFRAFPQAGVVALFDEPNQTGNVHDFDASRNAPAKTPADWLPNIYFHSSLDYMETVFSDDVVVDHPLIVVTPGSGFDGYVIWSGVTEDHVLYEHNLGYPPIALVAIGNNIIWPGMLILVDGGVNFWRYGTVYCNNTHVRLFVKTAVLSGNNAPATSATYKVLAFKEQSASGDKLINFDSSTGVTTMGLGRFNSAAGYLQVVPGGSPLGFAQGRTIDLNNGSIRAFRPDGTFFQPGGGGQFTITPGTGALGSPVQYAGSYPGPPTIQVQAP
jgi:hypothetical protein